MGWMKSLRDSEKSGDPPSLLEVVIVGSVVIAVMAFIVWFFIAAGSPLRIQGVGRRLDRHLAEPTHRFRFCGSAGYLQAGEARRLTCDRWLQTTVDSIVGGQFRMERDGGHGALSHRDRVIPDLGEDLDAVAGLLDPGGPDEDRPDRSRRRCPSTSISSSKLAS